MVTISLSMIVKNEEKNLARCLNSVKNIVDEINIVDTGSLDNTKEIAQEYTDRIFDFKWINDFSAARNESFKKATKDFILWLDADDFVSDEDVKKLAELKKDLTFETDAVSMIYQTAFDENGKSTFSFRRNRLVRRQCGFKWYGKVHEYLEVYGNIIKSNVSVQHLGKNNSKPSQRNLNIYREMIEKGIEFTPREMYYYANECFDHNLLTTAATYYEKFLESGKGWSEDCISACVKLSRIYLKNGNYHKAAEYSFQTFLYDVPRAEACCQLGTVFLTQNQLEKSIFWYELASKLKIDDAEKNGGFVNHSYYTWYPHVQLCVCYDKLKNYAKARIHHEQAKAFAPDNPYVKYNEKYFNSLFPIENKS